MQQILLIETGVDMSSVNRYFIKTEILLHWGFTSRKYVTSKTRESYTAPPPTALIGSLAYGLAIHRKQPEEIDNNSFAETVREKILSVNIKINTPLIPYSDISRIHWFREREKTTKYDAVAIGKTYKGLRNTIDGKADLEVIYLFNDERLTEGDKKDLFIASLSISRLGGSYGIVSVLNSSYGYATKISKEEAEKQCISYSTWSELIDVVDKQTPFLKEIVVDYKKNKIGDYTTASFREHIYFYRTDILKPQCSKVSLISGSAKAYKVGDEVIIVEE